MAAGTAHEKTPGTTSLLATLTPTGVYKPPFSPPSRGGKNISPLSEQGRKLAVFLKKNKRQMPEHKEEE